jgi:hypothetical protein
MFLQPPRARGCAMRGPQGASKRNASEAAPKAGFARFEALPTVYDPKRRMQNGGRFGHRFCFLDIPSCIAF